MRKYASIEEEEEEEEEGEKEDDDKEGHRTIPGVALEGRRQ